MGTHERLGEGYSSYDGPCAVRRLANDHDVLGLIGDYVRGKPKRTLAPPPREVVLLRFRLANVDRERVDWRQAADDLQVRLATATAEAQRWARQAASARNEAVELRSSCERRVAAEAQRVEEVQEGAAAWKELHQRTWTQQRKVERQEAAAAAREKERWLTERWMDERAAREAHGLRHVSELESMSGDRRDEIKRLAAERDAAEAAATEFERQYHEQQAAAERLRSARNGSALERQAALEQELREAKRRRTQNQRRLSDANLSDTRWRNAQAQLDSLREQLAEYMMEDEGQRSRATRADAFERQVAELQSQLESETAKLRSQIAELQSQHKEETAELRLQLKEQTEQCAKYRAVAEPSKAKFFADRRYTADVDLTSLEVIADLGVSANVVPRLFFIFARFYGIKIPTRKVRVLVGRDAAGKRVYEEKDVPYIPGLTHMKELPAIGRELHKLQVGEWLLQDPDGNYCYIADGANSQQREILAQILSRRNKETGRLESMSLSIDEITDKTSEGQLRKFTSALEAIAEGWEEAASLGLLDMPEQADDAGADAGTTATPDADAGADAEPPASAAAFFEQRRKLLRAALRGKIAGLRAASSMNDRAPNARKAGRLGRGGNGSGGEGDVTDDPTCAHHAVANIGEEGRKAIDKRLKAKMNITEEQSEADSAKVKALRTNVGWFSSPSCSLIYQVCKYVALFSSKGYAIGENFGNWLAHKLKTTPELAAKLIGHVEDLMAICGGRDYVFFLDAAVVDRFAQLESLYGYLLEEADLGAEAGGKLRKAIITGFESVFCMSAVRSMAVISDAWLWPMLRAIEPGPEAHILDVCPVLWPRTHAWLEEAADNPQSVIDGTISLRSNLEAAGLRVTRAAVETPTQKRRSERAQLDLLRIRAAIDADAEVKAEVHAMLSDAFSAMAAAVCNHASEFMPGGCCCTANITPELRARLSGMPITSVSAETMFARVKRRAERGGIARHDTRMGAVECSRDKTVVWARDKANTQGLLNLAGKRWRNGSGKCTMADERALKGEAKAPERTEKLAKKRRSRTKKVEELERLKGVQLVATYSALKDMGNERLADQLKIYKLLEKQKGFKTTGSGREMRLQLQSLIAERFGAVANDLADGDSGLEGRETENDGKRRARKVAANGGKGGKGKKRKRANIVSLHGWEWDADEDFIIERIIGKMVAEEGVEIPGRGMPGRGEDDIKPGEVLYKVLWEGFPPEIATWEEEDAIPCGDTDFVREFEAGLAEEEGQGEAESESEDSDAE